MSEVLEQNQTGEAPQETEPNEKEGFDDKVNELRAEHAGVMDDIGEWIASKLSMLRLGHEMVMLDDVRRVLKGNRKAVDRHQGMTFDGLSGAEDTDQGEVMSSNHPLAGMEEMFNLGNININPTPQENQNQPQQPMPQQSPQPPLKKRLGNLAKAGIGAALMATGAGAGAGLPLVWDAIMGKDDPVAPVTDTDTDTDTYYELRLHPPTPGDDEE